MRLFWAGFLVTGLLLIAVSAYEQREASARGEATPAAAMAEDGTGFPQPYPTPTPRP
jgi:hypothetical protein